MTKAMIAIAVAACAVAVLYAFELSMRYSDTFVQQAGF